jgi:hypothetical protein
LLNAASSKRRDEIYCTLVKAVEYRALRVRGHWVKAGDDALDAARVCAANEHWRSAVNRSYYAAYSYAASVLTKEGVDFRDDRVGPEHEPLPELMGIQLKKLFGAQTLLKLR